MEVSHNKLVAVYKKQRGELKMCRTARGEGGRTHVSIVTALLGTVRMRLIERPLYSADQPSFTMSLRVVRTIPARGCRLIIPSDDASSASGRRCVWRRVRITSCGYVATDAVIFEMAEHRRIVLPVMGVSESRSVRTGVRRWQNQCVCTHGTRA